MKYSKQSKYLSRKIKFLKIKHTIKAKSSWLAGLRDHFNQGQLSIEAFFQVTFLIFPLLKAF